MFIIFPTVDPELDTATVGNSSRTSRIAAYDTMADVTAKKRPHHPLLCVAKKRALTAISQNRPPWQRIDLPHGALDRWSLPPPYSPGDVIAPLHLTIPRLPPFACF
jgi:hypothetical protein